MKKTSNEIIIFRLYFTLLFFTVVFILFLFYYWFSLIFCSVHQPHDNCITQLQFSSHADRFTGRISHMHFFFSRNDSQLLLPLSHSLFASLESYWTWNRLFQRLAITIFFHRSTIKPKEPILSENKQIVFIFFFFSFLFIHIFLVRLSNRVLFILRKRVR